MSAIDREDFGRLRWACRRGIRELDVLLTRYADEQFPSAPAAQQAAFRALLERQNSVIYAYCLGQSVPPDEPMRVLIGRITSGAVADQ